MRLTVRTLLAWRDRVLSKEDQRDLDEKVLSHNAAQEIEQRIERVLGPEGVFGFVRIKVRDIAPGGNVLHVDYLSSASLRS